MKAIIGLIMCSLVLISQGCVRDVVCNYERTLLVYMAGDNSLRYYVEENTANIEKGVMKNTSINTRVVVLFDDGSERTRLYEITKDGRKEVKDYGENLNTGDQRTLNRVIEDVKRMFPSASYGLVLWSHGSGWLPPETRGLQAVRREVSPLAFGQDIPTSSWMSTDDLVEALHGTEFEFILFDACYMASIELLYALRGRTKYFIVSPTEIMADGFPYQDVVPLLHYDNVTCEAVLSKVCTTYFEFYTKMIDYPYASISLVKSSGLEPLAESIRESGLSLDGVSSRGIQQFHRQSNIPCYDFTMAYIEASGGVQPWVNDLQKAVLLTLYTPKFLNLSISTCSGLSVYIPGTSTAKVDEAYKLTEWFKATVPAQ